MSDLTAMEKRKFERVFEMGGGYVLDFSNRTFEEFVLDSTGREIYDERYNYASGSKANQLRGFWSEESNYLVGKLLGDLLDYGLEIGAISKDSSLEDHRRIAARLTRSPVPDLDALMAVNYERDFEAVAKAVRDAIDSNQPEAGLDRLHTFVMKFVRNLCSERELAVTRDKPLHSLFGGYVKSVRAQGHIESEMTDRILKSSISILEAFNHVRNEQSLAHDNPILNYDEALLIFNHVASSVRFLRSLESRIGARKREQADAEQVDDIPF